MHMTQSANARTVESLLPTPVWQIFALLADTPRPSKKEQRVREVMRAWAADKGLKVREVGTGNLVIDVPATKGCEAAPITVLQGHLDMVCEQNAGTGHDFDREPIKLVLDKDPHDGSGIVRADRTTLGADNGMGVAMALAAATSPDVVHGPLEILLTLDEEDGMSGAKSLAPDHFRGRRMLNLDTEADNSLTIGCAGGTDTVMTWEFPLSAIDGGSEVLRVSVTGLRGGHSGTEIHEKRGNANKILASVLAAAGVDGFRLASIHGGAKRNAIPREAFVVLAASKGAEGLLTAAAEKIRRQVGGELEEPGLRIGVERLGASDAPRAMLADDSAKLIKLITKLPHGVVGMHPKIPSLVETSNNVATIKQAASADGAKLNVELCTLSRSSSAAELAKLLDGIRTLARAAQANLWNGNDYPGWAPNVESPLLAVCKAEYAKVFGVEPIVEAVHAGLECGIISDRVGGVDAVSMGPKIEGAHTPDERVYPESVLKSWKFLVAVLRALSRA
jgi:dipeptidase D